MASKRCRNDTSLPWILAIEALASNLTDTSLLVDLVKNIPGDFSENEGKNARKLVSLRILESLSGLEKGKSSYVLPKPDSSGLVNHLDCCEDVLRQVLLKSSTADQKSTESEMSKIPVEVFVENTRASLPKCGLEQLKDVILKDEDFIHSAVKEKSGLLCKNYSDGNATRPERSNSDAFENPPDGNATRPERRNSDAFENPPDGNATRPERSNSDAFENPPVRDLSSENTIMSDSATANPEGSSACNQLTVYKEYPHNNASLKRKLDAFCTQKAVEGEDLTTNKRRIVDDVVGGTVYHSGREDTDLPRESQRENLRETGLLHNQLQGTCNVEKITQGTSGEEHGLNISADKAKKDGVGYAELGVVGSSPRFINQGTSVDGTKEHCEHSSSQTPKCVRCGEVKATMEHDHQPEALSGDENNEILVRNYAFLNSQYSHSQDSLATLNGTQKHCMVCKIGGQLLFCSSGSCQRVVHEKCIGVAPTFDAARSFYCPFCAYSQAISEYSESKEKVSLARKALVAFINRDEYRRNSSNVSCGANQNHLREPTISDKRVEQNCLENAVSREIENSSRKNMRDKPSVSCDLSSRGRAKVVTCGENEVALEDKREADRGSSSACCQSPSELEQQNPDLGIQNGESESSQHGGSEPAPVEKLQEVSYQPKGVSPVTNKDDRYVASQAVKDIHNSKSKDLKIAHRHKKHAGTEKNQDVSNQPPVLPCEPAKTTHSDVARSSGEKKESLTHPSLRVRKQENQYTYPPIPLSRRRKIPWSNAEVETLKEGVKRFAGNHDRQMPWKTILEFGADIFENRTTIDLKDKWRNISKGSPKV